MNSSNVTLTTASTVHKTVVTTLVVVVFLLNAVCLMLTARIAYRKPQWPNVLLVHIGLLDFSMVLLVLLPMTVAHYIPNILNFVHFCRYQGTVLNMWYILEFSLLVQIMFDRYFAISHPFVYSKRILKSKALVWSNAVFIGTAVVAILIACLPVATGVDFIAIGPGLCFWDISQDNALPSSTINVVLTLTSLILLIFLTGGICVGVLSILRKTHVGNTDNVGKRVNKMEVNFAKLAIITSLVVGVSSIPFLVSSMIVIVH